jgi:GT2 family glycosyltransferase
MISIVMSYFNRKSLLNHTLTTISKSVIKDIELVIVDDFSYDDQELTNEFLKDFNFKNIKLIKMNELLDHKSYVNPCIPYNVGLRYCSGDKIIIQNPECCHIGDVIEYVDKNLKDNNYLSFHCYASSSDDLKLLHQGLPINYGLTGTGDYDGNNWYNHKSLRPVAYHFTSAITRNNLIKLNGFDERFAHGKNYDDNEFIDRVKLLGLSVDFVETPFVIHQYHGKMKNKYKPKSTIDNKNLYLEFLKNPTIRANNKENI